MKLSEAISVLSDEKIYCEIDAETRRISVPDAYQILGVESDEDVERVWFKVPKIVGDNIDLSTLTIFVNYENAIGEKDRYYAQDMTVEGDYITFSWLVSRKCAKAKGTIKFIVCAKQSQEDEITNEWNTTVAQAQILEGLEPDEITEETDKDIIMQLLNELDEIKAMGGAGAPSFVIRDNHLIAIYDD